VYPAYFFGNVHQDVRTRIASFGVEDQVELDAVVVADDRHVIACGSVQQAEPQHPVEFEGAIEITHPNADVIDALDRNSFVHDGLLASGIFAQRTADGPHRRQLSAKVRLFLDMLADQFAKEPCWADAVPPASAADLVENAPRFRPA
jgi:hypothetical protein